MKQELLTILMQLYAQDPECILAFNFNTIYLSFNIFFHDKTNSPVRKDFFTNIDENTDEKLNYIVSDLKPYLRNV